MIMSEIITFVFLLYNRSYGESGFYHEKLFLDDLFRKAKSSLSRMTELGMKCPEIYKQSSL